MDANAIVALSVLALVFGGVIASRRAQGLSWSEVFAEDCSGSGLEWMGVGSAKSKACSADRDDLETRVRTLEKIVSDPADRLRREIDSL